MLDWRKWIFILRIRMENLNLQAEESQRGNNID